MPRRKNPHKAKTVGEALNPFDQQSKNSRTFRQGMREVRRTKRRNEKGKQISTNCRYVNGKWVCNKW